MPLGCLASLFGVREPARKPPVPAPAAPDPEIEEKVGTVPTSLPLKTKRYFFSPDENTFFRSLEESLAGTPYRAFPNVRLEDIFTITDKAQYASVRGRVKAKHVDFLIVDTSQDFKPVMAIELDGRSHQRERQQYNDQVKDVIFRSAGLPLFRLESRRYTPQEIIEKVKQAAG